MCQRCDCFASLKQDAAVLAVRIAGVAVYAAADGLCIAHFGICMGAGKACDRNHDAFCLVISMSFAGINSGCIHCCTDNQLGFPICVCPFPAVRQLYVFDLFIAIRYIHLVCREVRRIARTLDVQRDGCFCYFVIFCIVRCKYHGIRRLIAVRNVRFDCGIFPRKASAHCSAGNAVLYRAAAQCRICKAFAPGDLCSRRILYNDRLCFLHLHCNRRADGFIILRSRLRKDRFISAVVHSRNNPGLLPAPCPVQSRSVYARYNATGQIAVFQRLGRIIGSLCHTGRRSDGRRCLIDHDIHRSIDRLILGIRRFKLPCAHRDSGIRYPAAVRPSKRAFNDISGFVRKYCLFKNQLRQRLSIGQHVIFQPYFHAGL